MSSQDLSNMLISVIIPCYNHAYYLSKAIDSVLAQSHKQVEILVVNDGSKDHPEEVIRSYSNVKYFYQTNRGPSSARNTGIKHSSGKYLVFLDADDWLLENALSINLEILQQNEKAAFVSGGHVKVDQNNELIEEVKIAVEQNHYCHLLQGNYIGMHAAVMYQRWVFDTFSFDVSLKASEDYELYLKIAKIHPIIHHTHSIAAYRIRHQNTSVNITKMLPATLAVLFRQQPYLSSEEEKICFRKGLQVWKEYYSNLLYQNLLHKIYSKKRATKSESNLLRQHAIHLYEDYMQKRKQYRRNAIKRYVKAILPSFILNKLHKANNQSNIIPPSGKINMGDFNRTSPFSKEFGYDRGGPVDRYYIENFLQKQSSVIRGRVLEIGDNEYTLRFGASKVIQSDILHVDEKNAKATFIGDLSNAPQIPSDSFDCIILTQTLHLIYHFKEALETCYRILKPGGTLLLTVPGISHIDYGEWKDNWLWSFTDNAVKKMLSEIFAAENIEVNTFGNVLVVTAFLYGMGMTELTKEQLDEIDPHYQLTITASAFK